MQYCGVIVISLHSKKTQNPPILFQFYDPAISQYLVRIDGKSTRSLFRAAVLRMRVARMIAELRKKIAF